MKGLVALATFVAAFFLARPVLAQVVINELSSATSDDWIEIYNTSTSEVNLDGWVIGDTALTPVYTFADLTILPGQGFCVQPAGERLNKDGDRIKLFSGSEEKDCVAYGDGNKQFCKSEADVDAPTGSSVAARKPNGIGGWVIASETPGFSNDEVSPPSTKTLCYTLTPTLTSTPTPIALPPTPTPTPYATYKLNESKDENGNPLRDIKIYVDDSDIHHEDDEILNFCPGCHCDLDKNVDCDFGEHDIRLEKSGWEDWEETRELKPGDSFEVNPILKKIVPTATPTSTPTRSPTSTPKPSLTSTPAPVPTVLAFSSATESGEVLGETAEPEASLAAESVSEKKKILPFPVLSAVAVGLGLGLIGLSGFLYLKNSKKKESLS